MSPFLAKGKQQCDSGIAAGLCELQQQGQHTLIYPIQLLLRRFSRQSGHTEAGKSGSPPLAVRSSVSLKRIKFYFYFLAGEDKKNMGDC